MLNLDAFLELIQSDTNLFGEIFATALFLAIFAWAVLAMRRGWRTRSGAAAARFGAAPTTTMPPRRDPDGTALCTGTTVAGSRMERVALPELFGRWRCDWWIEAGEVLLRRPDGVTLRLGGVTEAGVTGAHAGRAVGRERIAVVRWTLGEHNVDTGLQFAGAEEARAFTDRLQVAVDGGTHA